MARIRTIKPQFWDDLKIGRLSRDARLLYIGLWNFADDLGVVIADPVWLKSKYSLTTKYNSSNSKAG